MKNNYMRDKMNNKTHNDYYCCYRIQAEKKRALGYNNSKMEQCLEHCTGYDSNCPNYTPFRRELKIWKIQE